MEQRYRLCKTMQHQLIVLRPFLKKGLKIGVTPTEGITKQNIIGFM